MGSPDNRVIEVAANIRYREFQELINRKYDNGTI